MTDCEIRDLQNECKHKEDRILELNAEIANRNKQLAVCIVGIVVLLFLTIWASIQVGDYKSGAINRGYMIYSPTTGVLQWVEPNKK